MEGDPSSSKEQTRNIPIPPLLWVGWWRLGAGEMTTMPDRLAPSRHASKGAPPSLLPALCRLNVTAGVARVSEQAAEGVEAVEAWVEAMEAIERVHERVVVEAVGMPPSTGEAKAPVRASSHVTLRHDSGNSPIRLILLSRLLQTKDEARLEEYARSSQGEGLLRLLRIAFLEAAQAVAGSQAAVLTDGNVQSLFNAAGSMLAKAPLYSQLLSVPDRLPFEVASGVYRAMLDAIGAERNELLGTPSGEGSSSSGSGSSGLPASMLDRMYERLNKSPGSNSDAGASSSYSSADEQQPSRMQAMAVAHPMPPPAPPAIPMPLEMAPASLPALRANESLASNCIHLVEAVTRQLSDTDRSLVAGSLEQALGLLRQPAPLSAAMVARALRHTRLLDALVDDASNAMLLAQVVEAAQKVMQDGDVPDKVQRFTVHLRAGCDEIVRARRPPSPFEPNTFFS